MAGFRRFILQDLGTKVLALILALAVYVHVFSGQEREMVYRVPLQLSPPPAGLSFTGDIPREIKIRIHAPGKELLRLRTRRFHAEIKLDAAHVGTLQRPILGSDVKLPWAIRGATVEVIEPQSLELTIERTATAKLPVAVRMSGELPTDRALASMPRPEPATVRVSGPSSLLAVAESVLTEAVDLTDVREKREFEARLAVPRGLTLETDRVHVTLDAVEKRVRSTGPVKIELIQAQGSSSLRSDPEFAAVLLSGPVVGLDGVDLRAVRILAEPRRANPKTQRVPLRALVPGLRPHSTVRILCDPESVTVRP
jgi:hypothetical protein